MSRGTNTKESQIQCTTEAIYTLKYSFIFIRMSNNSLVGVSSRFNSYSTPKFKFGFKSIS